MNYDVEIVETYPVGVSPTGGGLRILAKLLLEALLHIVGNRRYLRSAVSLANEEELCRAIVQFAEVELDDVLALNVTNGVQNKVQTFFRISGKCSGGGGGCIQNN